MKDQPLFDAPITAPLELSGQFELSAGQRGAYARYRPVKRVACDECVAFLHSRHGVGPLPRSARHTRRALGEMLRLCQEHTEPWRARDAEIEPL